jgi:hypothetical protein
MGTTKTRTIVLGEEEYELLKLILNHTAETRSCLSVWEQLNLYGNDGEFEPEAAEATNTTFDILYVLVNLPV